MNISKTINQVALEIVDDINIIMRIIFHFVFMYHYHFGV